MKKKITLALAAIVILGSIGYGATVAVARADDQTTHPFIELLAERFGLNEDEVEEALDEFRAEKFAQIQQTKEERLQDAVDDGVITEEQKQALLEKHQEMWQEKIQERQQHSEEMDAWFEQEGIDRDALVNYMGGFGRHHGGFGHWGMGM